MAKRGQPGKGNAPNKRGTKPLDVGACTCYALRASVGEDHAKDCPLYRRRGSGISVLTGPREQGHAIWYSGSEHAYFGRRKRNDDE